jgi:hypothetical protein
MNYEEERRNSVSENGFGIWEQSTGRFIMFVSQKPYAENGLARNWVSPHDKDMCIVDAPDWLRALGK